jgi:hypothetical protein
MAVTLADDRVALVLCWDPDAVGDPDDKVQLETANLEDLSDTSSRENLKNDGFATVTVPNNKSGSFTATITGPKGSETGTIDY